MIARTERSQPLACALAGTVAPRSVSPRGVFAPERASDAVMLVAREADDEAGSAR